VAPSAVGYLQAASDGEAERAAVAAECERRGWRLDVASGMGLGGALGHLDAGDYAVLVVARLESLSTSPIDVYRLMDRAHRHGWALVCLDPRIDTTSQTGAGMAAVAGEFARLERELLAQRREAMAGGARVKRGVDPETLELVIRLHEEGRDDHEIAAILDGDGVPSPRGRGWTDRAVARLLDQHHRAAQPQAGAASSSAMRSRSSRDASSVNGSGPE
jgi:DNA invertase Pin-like site-specific DNA recombinase